MLDYLHPKVTGCKSLPSPCFVKEFDLYGNMNPEQIWEQLKGSASGKKRVDVYFFTTLKKKKSRISRTIEDGGTWSNQGSEVVSTRDTKQPIGKKRRFSYHNPGKPQQNGDWVMHQYSLDVEGSVLFPPPPPPSTSTTVLCRLRKKDKNKKTNSRKNEVQPQLQDSHTDVDLGDQPVFISYDDLFGVHPSTMPEPSTKS